MVMTVLEGRVTPDKVDELKRAYRELGAGRLPAEIYETFLLRSTEDPDLWRIVTVWRSRDELDAYRKSVATPTGVLIFRQVGTEPTLQILEVEEHGSH